MFQSSCQNGNCCFRLNIGLLRFIGRTQMQTVTEPGIIFAHKSGVESGSADDNLGHIFRDYKEYGWEYIIIKEMKQVWITLGKNTILSSNFETHRMQLYFCPGFLPKFTGFS